MFEIGVARLFLTPRRLQQLLHIITVSSTRVQTAHYRWKLCRFQSFSKVSSLLKVPHTLKFLAAAAHNHCAEHPGAGSALLLRMVVIEKFLKSQLATKGATYIE